MDADVNISLNLKDTCDELETNSEIGVVSKDTSSSIESQCTSTVNEEDNVSLIEKNTEANWKRRKQSIESGC